MFVVKLQSLDIVGKTLTFNGNDLNEWKKDLNSIPHLQKKELYMITLKRNHVKKRNDSIN